MTHEDRRTDKMMDKLLRLWPVAAVLVAAVTGYIKLQIDVSNVQKCPEQIAALKERVTIIETQLAFFQNRYRQKHGP